MNPSYSDAVDSAAEGISELRRSIDVHGYAIVLIASIIGDMYEVETGRVVRDLQARLGR